MVFFKYSVDNQATNRASKPAVRLILVRFCSRLLNAHGTKASPDGSCASANNSQPFSCWFCCKSLRLRRGRCGNVCFHRHCWATYEYGRHTLNIQLYRASPMCLPTLPFGPLSPRHAAYYIFTPTAVRMGRKKSAVCRCRYRSGGT